MNNVLNEIRSFTTNERRTRARVNTLALQIERGLASAAEALTGAGAERTPDALGTPGRTGRRTILQIGCARLEIDPNPKWDRRDDDDEAHTLAETADASAQAAAEAVRMDLDPKCQAPYRADVMVRSSTTGAIAHIESILVIEPRVRTNAADGESQATPPGPPYAIAVLTASSWTVRDLEGRRSSPSDINAHHLVDEWIEHRIAERSPRREQPVEDSADAEAWAARWGSAMLDLAKP